ncbi:MAG: SDR family oxidoreductase [Planctomycetes bacterium]|nr:SDR family oxidoreductase [Planctomycetota bacterium]
MKVLVTGGAGFIGSHLVDRLVADGHRVVVLDNLATGRLENLAAARPHLEFLEGDLRDRVAVERAVAGCEVVWHQAALASVARSVENPREVTEVNVGGTLNLLVAARDAKVRRIVFASSSSVYGDTPELPKRESMPLTPRSPYAASKAAGESYLSAFQAAYGLEAVSLRYFNVYGPRQSAKSLYAAAVPRFVEAALAGLPATVYGDGLQTRDFTYVGDVVDALLRAATAPRAVEGPMNVGGGRRISILDLIRAVGAAAGCSVPPRHEPARVGDVRDSLADVARARERLGWEPATPIDRGIARVVAAARAVAPSVPAGR